MDNILLGIQLPSQSEIENQLKKITSDLSKLKNNQIIIDLSLKDNGIVDKIKNIDTVFKSLQNSANNISFNSLEKSLNSINNSVKSLGNLNVNTKGIVELNKELDNLNNKDYTKAQNNIIKTFGEQSGLAVGKEFNKAFKQSIIDNFNSGDIDKILSDSLKINDNINNNINKSMSKDATKDVLSQYEGFIKEIKGTKISLNNIEFDKNELKQIKDGIRGTLSIDNIKGIGIDSVMDEWTDSARKFGFTLDGVIQDKTLELANIISQYKDIKKNGVSSGLTTEDEASTVQKVTMAYMDLIESLETLEKKKGSINNNFLSDNDSQLNNTKREIEEIIEDYSKLNTISTGKTTVNGNLSKETQQLADGMGKVVNIAEKYNTVNGNLESTTVTVTNSERQRLQVEERLSSLQQQLSSSSQFRNSIFNNEELAKSENLINNLQNRLNELKNSGNVSQSALSSITNDIKNLSQSDSQINRVKNAIEGLENQLTSLKGKYKNLVGDSNTSSQLNQFQSELGKLKNAFSELSNGKVFSGSQITSYVNSAKNSFSSLKTEVVNSSNALKIAQQDAVTFGDAIKRAFTNSGIYMSTYEAIQMVTNAFKEGVQHIIKVEDSLIDLQRVYQMTDGEAKTLTESVSKQAYEMGTNTQTLLDLTTTWKKLGYTIQEAQGLAQVTQKFDLAGDLGNTTETANSLVSMLKGFKLDVGQNVEQQAMQIGDFINSASNNFAVSSKDITESLQRSSSALGAMGNNIQQSISMSTVMNEILQNAEKTGNSLVFRGLVA